MKFIVVSLLLVVNSPREGRYVNSFFNKEIPWGLLMPCKIRFWMVENQDFYCCNNLSNKFSFWFVENRDFHCCNQHNNEFCKSSIDDMQLRDFDCCNNEKIGFYNEKINFASHPWTICKICFLIVDVFYSVTTIQIC
jgi:hypothetical protein